MDAADNKALLIELSICLLNCSQRARPVITDGPCAFVFGSGGLPVRVCVAGRAREGKALATALVIRS
jgi:hypothetical protein